MYFKNILASHINSLKGLKPLTLVVICKTGISHELQNSKIIMCGYIHTAKNAKLNTLRSSIFLSA